MTRAHGLHRLSLAAIRRAPKSPMIARANCVTRIPEFRGDPAVAGIFQHTAFFAALDFPADLRRKLELIAAVVDGPRAICLHEDAFVRIGNQIVIAPRARVEADIRHANDGQTVPAFRAHRASRTLQADEMSGFAIREVATELPILDDVRALGGDALIIIGKGSEARPVLEPRVGDDVHNVRAVAQIIELVESEKTCARKIRFLPEHAIELDGMADRFVDLKSELAAAKYQRAPFLRTLRRGMKGRGFLADTPRVVQQVERLDELVTLQGMLSAKAVWIGSLLNLVALEGSRGNAAACDHFALVDARADAGSEPGINSAKLQASFRERDTLDAAHFGIRSEQQS